MQQHGQKASESPSKKQKKGAETTGGMSAFQKLFGQRAQGFQIDFRFRNAPPRPPVGPCFVGQNLDAVLLQQAQHYRALNTVEINHRWKLHNEGDLGVPLAPSAMNLKSYQSVNKDAATPPLHPDDEALLDWKGSLGDTAAEQLKVRRDRARAEARAAAAGRTLPSLRQKTTAKGAPAAAGKTRAKKGFSRVLDESMQSWMKKTTYLSNDYSRRVHDFKSLAQTKQQLAQDLEQKQQEIQKRRSKEAIDKSFDRAIKLTHPTKKAMKPKQVFSVLPNAEYWGMPLTHLIIDKQPKLSEEYKVSDLQKGFVTNVEKPEQNARMTCQVMVPARAAPNVEVNEADNKYLTVQGFDLDVIPLKEEDTPHNNFCLLLDKSKGVASYVPLPSRIQLSTGRPSNKPIIRKVDYRDESLAEKTEREKRLGEIDQDMAEKYDEDEDEEMEDEQEIDSPEKTADSAEKKGDNKKESRGTNDDGEDDFGDDSSDSDDEALFGTQ